MSTKTMQQGQESLDQIVSDLFPKEATKFSRALNDHMVNLVNEIVQEVVTDTLQRTGAAVTEKFSLPGHQTHTFDPGTTIDWTTLRPVGGGVAAAEEEGSRFKQETWSSDEMLTSDEAASRMSMSREALNNRRKSGRALALEAGKRGYRYPSWQFEDALIPAMPDILKALSPLDPWAQYLFFKQPEPLLKGEVPLNLLRKGKLDEVTRVARLLAAEAD
ncbi:hypothetical protein [Nitrosospira briensis]|uniref:hypothetical protein n=1 Tax=Nitrosospira briensis TaxID=35799 RepID=UPI00046A784A|nr:hypothetical protein [Nitrosospira briensis]